MGRKRVVFQIVHDLTPAGAERVVVHLVQYLDRSKYQPVCVCLGKPLGSHYEQVVRQTDAPLHFLGKGIQPSASVFWKLDRLFRQYRPEVVHTHIVGLNYAYPLMIRHRTPVRIHTVHNLAHRETSDPLAVLVRRLAFRYRLGNIIPVAIADEVARSIEQLYRYPKPPVIPNGVLLDDYAPNAEAGMRFRNEHGAPQNAMVILHIGRFVEQKNHALLLRAFAQLQSPHPLYLWLVGDGELRPAMEQLAQELGIAPRVRFWGVRSDVPDLLNAADIFTLPSKYEGNPMAVMEAMAAGLPVVATAVGGVPELVAHGVSGLLTPNEDEGALVEALQRLITTPELRRSMGVCAREQAQKRFDARVMTRAYEALYETVLEERCHRLSSK